MKSKMRLSLKFVLLILVLTLMIPRPACATWKNKSCDLPGIECNPGAKIAAVVAAGAVVAIVANYLHHRRLKTSAAGLWEVPFTLSFASTDMQTVLRMRNKDDQPMSLAEVSLGSGFMFSDAPSLPRIVNPGEEFDLTLTRQANSSRTSHIDIAVINSTGKTLNRRVTLHARRFHQAE